MILVVIIFTLALYECHMRYLWPTVLARETVQTVNWDRKMGYIWGCN